MMASRRALDQASVLFPAFLLALAAAAEAGVTTATLTVTASVRNGCSIENGSLDFGVYTSGQAEPLDGKGTIRVRNCPGVVKIELDGGGSNRVNDRRLMNGLQSLQYQLYKDPARTQIWGTGTDAQTIQILQGDTTLQVFGRIPGRQSVAAGTYTDSVVITMTF